MRRALPLLALLALLLAPLVGQHPNVPAPVLSLSPLGPVPGHLDPERASRTREIAPRPTPRASRSAARRVPAPRRQAMRVPRTAWGWAHSPAAYQVANCESGDRHARDVARRYNGNPHMSGRYAGKWQFAWSTWRSVGGSGNPAAASEAEQDYRAWLLWKRDGWSQWECASIMAIGN